MLVISLYRLDAATFTVINVNDSGVGSFRNAISNANAIAGIDVVDFNIPGSGPFTINLTAVLPSITEPVTIDATTLTGYSGKPLVDVDGNSAAGNGTGIYLLSSNCVVKGLSLSRFAREAIRIEGTGGNIIQGNHIGAGPFGTNALGNGIGASGFGGITVISPLNQIGGTSALERNIISGGNRSGILILNANSVSNAVQGNYIGVDVTGTKRLANANSGIMFASGSRWNVIGGTNNGERNIISGNLQSGIFLSDNTTIGNAILGNFIGTDVTGTSAISNATEGVTISGAVSNVVGGATIASRNLISGNGNRGVAINGNGAHHNLIQGNYIGTDVTGLLKVANTGSGIEITNAPNNTVGGDVPGAGNVISGNTLSGIYINGNSAVGNQVQGNLIGVNATGLVPLGNGSHGVFIASGAANNLIGGNTASERNVISGNSQNGVYISDAGTIGNQVAGNYIGTGATGNTRIGNNLSGVRVESPLNLIGGLNVGEGNVISGNTNNYGVFLTGSSSISNTIAGNLIGVDATGSIALGNGTLSGIGISGAIANIIGGTATAARNVISGNNDKGIHMSAAATRNIIQGNFIGTDATGMSAVANFNEGIGMFGVRTNTIGGSVVGAGNVIAGNNAQGINLNDSHFNLIQGNKIGVKADGVTALGNTWHGIEFFISTGSSNNIVGGPTSSEGNIIANAVTFAYDGVRIRDGTRNNQVRGNSIYGNGGSAPAGLGIDLSVDNVTANDGCDVDGVTFGNLAQNYPMLSNAVSGAGLTWVRGSLNSTANTSFLLQFYANSIVEPSGYGEGEIFLGETTVTTGAGCTTDFAVTLAKPSTAGNRITATATDPAGNTSEFGPTVVSIPQPTLSLVVSNAPPTTAIRWTNAATGFVLQQATNLNTPIFWSAVTNAPAVINNEFVVTLTPTSGSRFYRLVLP